MPQCCILGVIGQHAIVTPPVTAPPQQLAHPGSAGIVARMPMGADQLSSPGHPNSGVSLVRPVPQQPSPVRVSSDMYNCESTMTATYCISSIRRRPHLVAALEQ